MGQKETSTVSREDPMGAKGGRRKEEKSAVLTITSEPSEADLRPSEEARDEIEQLLDWERESKQRDWVVGRPCNK